MKVIGITSTAILCLLLGIAAPGYAQHEQQGEKQREPEKQAQPERQAKPEQQHAQQQKQAEPAKQSKPEQQHAQQQKQQEQNKQQQQHAQQQKQQEQNKQQHAQQQKRQDQRAGARGGGRIPEDRYRANFGREHTFRVSQADYRGRRFHYGGYWFGFVDPWPSNWLYTQNVYVVDMNGVYYLCNPMYPGVNIALSFTL
jgi:flagellar motor protein MotB